MDGLIAARAIARLLGVADARRCSRCGSARRRHPVIPPRSSATPQLAITYALEIVIGILEGALFFIPAVLVARRTFRTRRPDRSPRSAR